MLARFGQEVFEQAEAARGGLADPAYRALRADAARLARVAMETPLVTHRLDAVVALTASPAWLTDYALGDHDAFHLLRACRRRRVSRGIAAVRLRVGPAGGYLVHGAALERAPADRARLRVEQAASASSATAVPPHVTTGSPPHLAETLSP